MIKVCAHESLRRYLKKNWKCFNRNLGVNGNSLLLDQKVNGVLKVF